MEPFDLFKTVFLFRAPWKLVLSSKNVSIDWTNRESYGQRTFACVVEMLLGF